MVFELIRRVSLDPARFGGNDNIRLEHAVLGDRENRRVRVSAQSDPHSQRAENKQP